MDAELAKQLEAKMAPAVSTSYEALQYVQSFVARKKKTLGKNSTSRCVFHGAKLLVDRGNSGDAGALLVWFIESDDLFNLSGTKKAGGDETYCDTERILAILSGLSVDKAGPVVDQIYGPLHQVVSKAGLLRGAAGGVSDRMEQFERQCADIFEGTKKWYSAYKVVVRLGDVQRAARLLNEWSNEGNALEKPMFFGRAVLTLLADRKLTQAEELVRHSTSFITDNLAEGTAPGGPSSGPLGVWHLAVILSGLASLPPMQRVDKTRLFGLLKARYSDIVDKTDPRLHDLLMRVGTSTFAVALPEELTRNNPMAMIQQMMMASGGIGAGAPSGGGGGQQNQQVDLAAIMKHMSRLESMRGK